MNINIRLIYLLKTSLTRSLGKMCPYSELFWSVFLRIRTEEGETEYFSVFSPHAGKYGLD